MSGFTTKQPVNYDKLVKAIKDKGLTLSAASKAMGYDSSFIGKSKQTKQLKTTAILLLDKMYGIKYDVYKQEEPKKKEVTYPIPLHNLTGRDLYRIIYSATYHAMNKAFKDSDK